MPFPSANRAFVLRGIKDVEFEERPMPDESSLNPYDVIVHPKATGICGSDVHYVLEGRCAEFVLKKPMVLGHETAGVVYKVGSKVQHLKPGDNVVLEPGETCRRCASCKSGRYELCVDMIFAATPPYDGTLAGFYTLPSDLAFKLPEGVSLEEGAMIEPLSVGMHALNNIAKLRTNETVAVFGAGPVGLLTMAVAKALGAKQIIAVDIVDSRLEFAGNYVATNIYKPEKPQEGEERLDYSRRTAETMMKQFGLDTVGANGVDVVVDCTGAEVCIQTGVFLCKTGGRYVQVGMGAASVDFPISIATTKELEVRGSFRYGPGTYQHCIDLVAQKKIDLKPLITHRYKFDEAKEAFQTMIDGKSKDGKAPIKCIISGLEA